MNILIGGEDEVAWRLAEALMEDHDVTLIVPEECREDVPEKLDLDVHTGHLAGRDTLVDAQAAKCDLFVSCSPSDERNLVACVSAKQLGARRTTCFLFRREVQSTEKDASLLARHLGIDNVILPAERLSREILRIVTVPGALEVEAFEGGRVRLVRRAVEEDTPISQGTIADVGIPSGVVLVMARRGEETFIPNGSTQLLPGDQITAMGNLAGINRLVYRYLRPTTAKKMSRRATVVGGGMVGFDVAEGLSSAGWDVKVIDADSKRCEEISPKLKGLVLNFDGTDL
ncbi:MAG: NAD-binding protein, partial [Planctomycetes bacterium]|nr:NAD-binding protein [Planctomycetota bacterium]